MIKYFKLKKQKLLLETAIISKIYSLVDGIPDLIEFLQRAKDIDSSELQSLIASEIVKYARKDDSESK